MTSVSTDRQGPPAEGATADRVRGDSLTHERIVQAALAIVDREGLNALSMRRLAAELGVVPMATYYYIPNKEALLDAIVEAVTAEIHFTQDDPSSSPEDRILCAAKAYQHALLAHPHALPIVLSRAPNSPASMRPVEYLMGILRDAGLGPIEALAGMNVVAASVRGIVGWMANGPHDPQELAAFEEQFQADEFPNFHEAILSEPTSWEQAFELGIRALARGLLANVPGPEICATKSTRRGADR